MWLRHGLYKNASGALYDQSVKEIKLFNFKILTKNIELQGKKVWWLFYFGAKDRKGSKRPPKTARETSLLFLFFTFTFIYGIITKTQIGECENWN